EQRRFSKKNGNSSGERLRLERRLRARIEEARTLSSFSKDRHRLLVDLWLLRRQLAAEEGTISYRVLPNRVLFAICETLPSSARELAQIPGMGPRRLAAFGSELLAVLSTARGVDEEVK